MTAAGILLNLLLLTLLFTLFSGGALLLRRRLRGRENGMRMLWAAVLLLAVIPLYSSSAAISFGTGTEPAADLSARTEVPYVPGEDGDGYISDARRDIGLARKLYGENLPAVTVGDGSTGRPVPETEPDAGVFAAVCVPVFCVWIGVAVFMVLKSVVSYTAAKKLMRENSEPCAGGRISAVFDECRLCLGIGRGVEIRVVNENFSCTPCVAGMIRPVIYLDSECGTFSEDRLRFVFMHELCHIRRHDLLFKLFALTVTSLHWFNPLSFLVYRAVSEDCELACDNDVLKKLGRQHGDSYMSFILDIAERFCNSAQPVLENRLGGGLFLSGTPGRRFLERRYRNMKFNGTGKFSAAAAALFIIAALTANIVVVSSCGVPLRDDPATAGNGSGNIFLDEAIRGYYGLSDSDAITSEMIGGIETLAIRLSDVNSIADTENIYLSDNGDIEVKSGVMIVDYVVNGREILPFPKKVEPRRFDENYVAEISDYYLENSAGTAEKTVNKVLAFYCLKNYYDPALDDAERAEILASFPDAPDYPEGCYIYDPYASARETAFISGYFETADLYAGFSLLGGYFDASALAAFPNLVSVTYMGVTPVNEKLPDGCVSEYLEYQYSDIVPGGMPQIIPATESGEPVYGGPKGEEGTVMWNGEPVTIASSWGLFELEEKGMVTGEDGVEYLVFNSKALHAAILEYFVMEYGYSNRITAEHLAQITSIEAVIRTDLDYLFDDSLELHGGHYIQFTINGETQGIIPAYYNAKEFPCGKVSDMLYDAGYYELAEKDGNGYYRLTVSDESAVAETFRQLAVTDGCKSLVTGYWDEDGDGSAAFITEFSSSWDCVVARYVSGIPIARNELEADRQYFPNLETFSFGTDA